MRTPPRKRICIVKSLVTFGEARLVIVGTQMIAKGLDFPNVTLVGLIDADKSLHVEDFRAAERTFQLIVVQVSGRAGRGDRAGGCYSDRYSHAPPIQFARKSDFDGLVEELEQRREFDYPPFRHLIRHLFRGRESGKGVFLHRNSRQGHRSERWVMPLKSEVRLRLN